MSTVLAQDRYYSDGPGTMAHLDATPTSIRQEARGAESARWEEPAVTDQTISREAFNDANQLDRWRQDCESAASQIVLAGGGIGWGPGRNAASVIRG